jgi:dihydrofolate synthase/folylpolyglutamate synthase
MHEPTVSGGDGPDRVPARVERPGIALGLERISALAAALGHPQRRWPSVLVAGTNGKGSSVAMLECVLRHAGHHTGRLTSPPLIEERDQIAIDGVAIAQASFERAWQDAGRAARTLPAEATPTRFELTVATAFLAFAEASVDIAVIEAGMGGRRDATNVVDRLACAVTTVDLDHTDLLGRTIAEIAEEKGGIVTEGIPLVTGETKPEALAVLSRIARERHGRLVRAFEGVRATVEIAGGVTWLDLETPGRSYGRLRLALGGRHQADNAVVAVRVAEELEGQGFRIGAEAVRDGLSRTVWPGRLHTVDVAAGRRLLIDAAHNPAGAAALASYLRESWPAQKRPLVFGVMRDKAAGAMLEILAPAVARLVFTQAATGRAYPAGDLLALHHELGLAVPADAVVPLAGALQAAFRDSPAVVVAGSVLLAGDVLRLVDAPEGRAL